MNRTIEQWVEISEHVGNSFLIQAISDLQELARQLETERAAWSAKRAEVLRNHAAELVRRKTAEAQRDELLAALKNVLPWVVMEEINCHGSKCKEPICMACNLDSEESALMAAKAYLNAGEVIRKVEKTK